MRIVLNPKGPIVRRHYPQIIHHVYIYCMHNALHSFLSAYRRVLGYTGYSGPWYARTYPAHLYS